jgi:hypothetical protein
VPGFRARADDRDGATGHRFDPIPAPVGRQHVDRPTGPEFDAFVSKTSYAEPDDHHIIRWIGV